MAGSGSRKSPNSKEVFIGHRTQWSIFAMFDYPRVALAQHWEIIPKSSKIHWFIRLSSNMHIKIDTKKGRNGVQMSHVADTV